MKATIVLSFLMLFISKVSAQSAKTRSINETYEWSHAWIVTKPDSAALQSILIIGDSHVERYQPVVAEKLKGKFYVSKITTAKSLGDPQFINQLKGLLGSFKFEIITFNNGLHGVKYTPDEYARYFPIVLKLLKKNNPEVKILWVNTTARRVNGSLDKFDEYNDDVTIRNEKVKSFCNKKGIAMIDFASMSMQHKDFYTSDGIHFNPIGIAAQAQEIINWIMK
jgi:hypothetical protein